MVDHPVNSSFPETTRLYCFQVFMFMYIFRSVDATVVIARNCDASTYIHTGGFNLSTMSYPSRLARRPNTTFATDCVCGTSSICSGSAETGYLSILTTRAV